MNLFCDMLLSKPLVTSKNVSGFFGRETQTPLGWVQKEQKLVASQHPNPAWEKQKAVGTAFALYKHLTLWQNKGLWLRKKLRYNQPVIFERKSLVFEYKQ